MIKSNIHNITCQEFGAECKAIPPGLQGHGGVCSTLDERSESYLYLSSNNSDEIELEKSEKINKLSPYHKKQAHVIYENCQRFIDHIGINRVGFLTLTFPENLTDHKEASRRFNNLNRRFISENFGRWAWVKEQQKRGAWHYHILIDCKCDIRSGFDFAHYKAAQDIRKNAYKNGKKYSGIKSILDPIEKKYISSASSSLLNLWKLMKITMKKYGFGISELLPIHSNAEATGRYVGKYVSNHVNQRSEASKGVRLSGYSKDFLRSSTKFQWNNDNSKKWRQNLSKFASYAGVNSLEELSIRYGKRWAYQFQEIIIDIDNYSPDSVKKFLIQGNFSPEPLENHPGPQYQVFNSDLIDRKTGEVLF
jgi:hypothetical protein